MVTALTDRPGRHRARIGHRFRGYEYRGPRARDAAILAILIIPVWLAVILG